MLTAQEGMLRTSQVVSSGISKPVFYDYVRSRDLDRDVYKRQGLINDRANRLAYADDSAYYLLCALEVIDEDGKLERKADMFTKRTIKPQQAGAAGDTASEALTVSISEKACVDMGYMSQLTGKTKEELAGELPGVIFRVPGQLEKDGTPHYLSLIHI